MSITQPACTLNEFQELKQHAPCGPAPGAALSQSLPRRHVAPGLVPMSRKGRRHTRAGALCGLACGALLLTGFVAAEAAIQPEVGFPVGETLTYQIYWGVIPVGQSRVRTEWVEHEGRQLLAIRFRTRTTGVLKRIYPVNDYIETLVEPETMLPVRFTKQLNEGRYHCDEVTHFDYDAGVARFHSRNRDRTKEYAIDESVRDLVSFMYNLRSEASGFQLGVEREYKVMADEKLYDILVKPIEVEKLKLPGYGRVRSVRFEPEAKFEGLFVRKGKLWVWVSDDDRRIVTRVQAKIPVASVKLVLADVDGPGADFWTERKTKEDK